MTTTLVTKSTGLVKTGGEVRDIARFVERALQSRNEKVARADAEYVDAILRAGAKIRAMQNAAFEPGVDPEPDPAAEREIELLDA